MEAKDGKDLAPEKEQEDLGMEAVAMDQEMDPEKAMEPLGTAVPSVKVTFLLVMARVETDQAARDQGDLAVPLRAADSQKDQSSKLDQIKALDRERDQGLEKERAGEHDKR